MSDYPRTVFFSIARTRRQRRHAHRGDPLRGLEMVAPSGRQPGTRTGPGDIEKTDAMQALIDEVRLTTRENIQLKAQAIESGKPARPSLQNTIQSA